jgi:hypothetical protein
VFSSSTIRLILVIFMKKVTFSVRQATLDDLITVSDILTEAAEWLEQKNMGLWKEEHISLSAIRQDIESGIFYIAFYEDTALPAAMRYTIGEKRDEG